MAYVPVKAKPVTQPEATQAPREFRAPQTAAKLSGVFFIRSAPIHKEFREGATVLADVLLGFGQPADSSGNNAGSVQGKAFGEVARFILGNVPRSSKVYVEGRLTEDRWTDKETGASRSKHCVMIDNIILLSAAREYEEEEAAE